MAKLQKKEVSNNLIVVVLSILIVSLAVGLMTAYSCDWVLGSFQNSNTMVMLITDAGIVSDDKNLEHELTQATATLVFLRDISLAMVIGSTGVMAGLFYKHIYRKS
jgi:archaellum component FlaG (FlaF/FlaG flagellin family)